MYLIMTEDQEVFQTTILSEKWINAVHEGVAHLFSFEDGQFIEFSLDHTWDVVQGEEDYDPNENPYA